MGWQQTLFRKEGNGLAEGRERALDPGVPFCKQEVCPLRKAHHSVRVKVIQSSVLFMHLHTTNLCPVPHRAAHLHSVSHEEIFCEGDFR